MKEISLSMGYVTKVDDQDYEYLHKYRWRAITTGIRNSKMVYAGRYTSLNKCILMHREILCCPDGVITDHRDMDGLNNQRHNIRQATYTQNNANRRRQKNNTSGYRGVWWEKNRSRWRASIRLKGKGVHLGYFKKKEDAAVAYKKAATVLFGAFYKEECL